MYYIEGKFEFVDRNEFPDSSYPERGGGKANPDQRLTHPNGWPQKLEVLIMKHLTTRALLVSVLLLLPNLGMAFPNHPLEDPPLESKISWNLKGNGLLFVSYDLDHNGQADYHTVHFVLKSYLTDEPLTTLSANYKGAPVFYVNYGPANQIYVISRKALFYAFDYNEDGLWDLMYKDVEEDGVNGNETFYASPSNMFSIPSQYTDQ